MVQSNLLLQFKNIRHFFFDQFESRKIADFGIKNDQIFSVEQVHGDKVILISRDSKQENKGYDGMITSDRLFLKIVTADCLPIFFYDYQNKVIGAIHAGWKGLAKGILKNTVKAMKKLGGNVSDFLVAIGPYIKACCYNVPQDRIDKFQIINASDRLYLLRDGRWYLDLGKIALSQLKSFGVKDSNIDVSTVCTSCDRNYYSFRRDRSSTGRMVNIIGLV